MTSKTIFELQKRDKTTCSVLDDAAWIREGFYLTYKAAQDAFIRRDGLFRIVEHEVKD